MTEVTEHACTDTESRSVVARGMVWGQMKWAEGVRGYKLSHYKINKSQGYNVQHGGYS